MSHGTPRIEDARCGFCEANREVMLTGVTLSRRLDRKFGPEAERILSHSVGWQEHEQSIEHQSEAGVHRRRTAAELCLGTC